MGLRRSRYLTVMVTGITAVMLGLIMAPVHFTNAASPPEMAIKASTDGVVLDFSTEGSRDLLTFKVRIIGPEHFIFEQSSQTNRLQWIPAAGVADGYYNWEAWVVTADPGAPTRAPTPALQERPLEHLYEPQVKQIHLASGSFRVQHGLVVVNQKNEAEAEEPSLTRRVATAIIDFVFPSAHADTFDNEVTVNRDTTGPRLALFDPTGDGLPWWRFQMTGDPGNHLEIRYCNFALFGCGAGSEIVPISIRRDTGRVGMGVTAPTARLHMNAETGEDGLRVQVDGLTGLYAHQNQGVTIGAFVPPPPRGLHVPEAGSVGLGTVVPAAPLHILRTDDTSEMILLEQLDMDVQDRNMILLSNNGGNRIYFRNQTAPESGNDSRSWVFATSEPGFRVSRTFSGQTEMELDNAGNLSITGTLTQGSSRSIKHNIVPLSGTEVLSNLSKLQFSEWSYDQAPGRRHAGPMAEEFFETFGLGPDNKHIAPGDMAGLSLAAIKALHEQNQQLVKTLNEENKQLKERLARIEKALLHSSSL